MISIAVFRKITSTFPGTEELPHFEKISFRVNKKIFATYDALKNQASIKLPPIDQDVFCQYDKEIIFRVANKWGQQGWTIIDLKKIPAAMFKDALTTAYSHVAPQKKLSKSTAAKK